MTIYFTLNNLGYIPVTTQDARLMQHCVNEDLQWLNEQGFQKLKSVANAHGWIVDITDKRKN